jgi:signal peptidase II
MMADTTRNGRAGGKAARKRLLPFTLTIAILVLDQLTKALVVARLPLNRPVEVIGDFLRFWYRTNTAVSFSLGSWLPVDLQRYGFLFLSLSVVALVLVYYFRARDLGAFQRWLLAAIVAGGLGNDIDRIARGSVVDFIDSKFWGILGMERWPTYNVADATVVVAGLLFMIAVIVQESRSKQ